MGFLDALRGRGSYGADVVGVVGLPNTAQRPVRYHRLVLHPSVTKEQVLTVVIPLVVTSQVRDMWPDGTGDFLVSDVGWFLASATSNWQSEPANPFPELALRNPEHHEIKLHCYTKTQLLYADLSLASNCDYMDLVSVMTDLLTAGTYSLPLRSRAVVLAFLARAFVTWIREYMQYGKIQQGFGRIGEEEVGLGRMALAWFSQAAEVEQLCIESLQFDDNDRACVQRLVNGDLGSRPPSDEESASIQRGFERYALACLRMGHGVRDIKLSRQALIPWVRAGFPGRQI